jgi:hypothetical protein
MDPEGRDGKRPLNGARHLMDVRKTLFIGVG